MISRKLSKKLELALLGPPLNNRGVQQQVLSKKQEKHQTKQAIRKNKRVGFIFSLIFVQSLICKAAAAKTASLPNAHKHTDTLNTHSAH